MITLALTFAGFLLVSLGMDKNHRIFFDGGLSKAGRAALKTCGWAILGLAMIVCCRTYGLQFGPVRFAGIATVAALLTMGLVTLRRESSAGRRR